MKKQDAKQLLGEVFDFGQTAYLGGASAVVTFMNSTNITVDADNLKNIEVTKKDLKVKTQLSGVPEKITFVSWGDNNKLPVEVMDKMYKNVGVAKNVEFNAQMVYGDDFMVLKRVRNKDGKIEAQEQLPSEQPKVFEFIEYNNLNRTRQEIGNDISLFQRSYVEIILSADRNIVSLRHLEACYSRVSVMNEKGKIEWHGYSAGWHNNKYPDDLVITPLLDSDAPLRDFLTRTGKLPNADGKTVDEQGMRYVLDVSTPTPGRFYYMKPYWWSIFESGWYDFACAIPEFKKALMTNSMALRYHVMISADFYDKLFKAEGITEEKKKKDRKAKFLKDMNEFLAGGENAGKSFVSQFRHDHAKGTDVQDIIIKPIEAKMEGGEYIEDSEEVSNIICYGMGVHPSLVGAAPGKNSPINGTEARELFIIKQALCKPIRDMITLPLLLVKACNGWDKDLQFSIANIMLTTLDKGTGSVKVIGDKKVN